MLEVDVSQGWWQYYDRHADEQFIRRHFRRKYGREPEQVGTHQQGQGHVVHVAGPVAEHEKGGVNEQ